MKLSKYLILNDIRPAAFARTIGLNYQTTLQRYLKGDRIPSPDIMNRITEATGGKVTARDFGARAEIANDNLVDELLPDPEYEPRRVDRLFRKMMKEPLSGHRLTPPLQKAVWILGQRVHMDAHKKNFWLDGRPVGAQDLVRKANEILKQQGQAEIHYPKVNPMF